MNHKRQNQGPPKDEGYDAASADDFWDSTPIDYQPESGVPVPERRADRDGGNDGRDPVDDI